MYLISFFRIVSNWSFPTGRSDKRNEHIRENIHVCSFYIHLQWSNHSQTCTEACTCTYTFYHISGKDSLGHLVFHMLDFNTISKSCHGLKQGYSTKWVARKKFCFLFHIGIASLKEITFRSYCMYITCKQIHKNVYKLH